MKFLSNLPLVMMIQACKVLLQLREKMAPVVRCYHDLLVGSNTSVQVETIQMTPG